MKTKSAKDTAETTLKKGTTTKTRKARGRELQNFIRDWLRELFNGILEDDDIKSQTMGMTGMDIVLSPAAKKLIPFAIECKNHKRPNLLAAYRQAKTNAGTLTPVAIIQAPKKERIVVIPFELFSDLIRHKSGAIHND